MNTLILGPGALGCALARHLSPKTFVRLIGPRPPRDESFGPLWLPTAPPLDAPTSIWLTCKASQLESVLHETLRPLLERSPRELVENSVLIAPQNGLGITDLILNKKLSIPLCRAAIWFGAKFEQLRLVETTPPRRITLGASSAQAKASGAGLQRAGFDVDSLERSDAAHLLEWKKGFTSIALNALVASHGVLNGELLTSIELQSTARVLQQEALSVFERLGLGGITREEAWSDLLRTCRETAANRNSMLQDLEAGRPLELPWLNEWLLLKGSELGIDLPQNRQIVEALHSKQNESS